MKQKPHHADRKFVFVLLVTLAGFLWRGVEYALIGSPLPLIFIGSVCILMCLSYYAGNKMLQWMIRIWAVLLILYGIARIAMAILLRIVDVGSMHAIESTGIFYIVLSSLYLIAGIILISRAGRFSR